MAYKKWDCVTKFAHGSTHVYFNKGTTAKNEPAFSINIQGANGYKSKAVIFEGMKVDFVEHVIIAVKETFGFDYLAYLRASGQLGPEIDGNGMTQQDYIDIEEQAEENAEAEEAKKKEPEPTASVVPVVEEESGCDKCGNEAGSSDWRFGWFRDVHISECLRCGKTYK